MNLTKNRLQIALIIAGLILMANHLIATGRLLDVSELPLCHGFIGLVLFIVGVANWNHWWMKL